jgi:glycosyltransferase involved in cell wall biosynthesis
MENNRILILCSYDKSIIHFRGDFIKSLIQNGYKVFGAAPEMTKEISDQLIELGASPLTFKLQRTGLNPFKDLQSILELNKMIKKHNIDLVFPYTIKPVIYGSIAANFAKIRVISLITGLGFTFSAASAKAKLLQKATEFLYKISIRKNKLIIFQNSDDHQLFLERNIIPKSKKIAVVNGSGVNLGTYPNRINNKTSERIIFILVARLIKEKGVSLYMEAAEDLKKRFPKAEFHVIGKPDKSPSAINLDKLNELHHKEIIVYHGIQDNVPELLYASDIFVLPTFYREGIPRSILEALSVGMPIITTNSPGCRETVTEGENGFLIKPQSLEDLKRAMGYFLENPIKIKEMGIASRALAEKKFNVDIINDHLIALIKETMTK